jgi:hypothetical protein
MTGPLKGVLRRVAAFAGLARLVIGAGLLCWVAAVAVAQTPLKEPGIGGTGHQPGEGNGIGGTGTPQDRAPTGIVGTITGFGSILVNNFEIDYPAGTQAKSDLDEAIDAKSLRIGQVVEIEAEGQGEHLRARRIGVRYEVSGPIESIDRASGNIRVLGQTVATGQSAAGQPGSPGSGSAGNLVAGDTVKVSGLRRADGVIVASLIDKADPRKPVWLRGHVDKADENGFTLNGVRVTPSGPDRALKPAAGEEIGILGVYSQGRLAPARIARLPKVPFEGRTARLSIEGYVASRGGKEQFLGGLSLDPRATAGDLRPGSRVIIEGRMGNGRFVPAIVRQPQFGRSIRENRLMRENRFMRERGGPVHPHEHKLWRSGGNSPHQAHPDSRGIRAPSRAPAHRGFWRRGRGRR